MRQVIETEHVLQIRERPSVLWHTPEAKMYQPARKMAFQDRLAEAIDTAEDIRIHEYGDMHGISFRVATTTRTVTTSGPQEEG